MRLKIIIICLTIFIIKFGSINALLVCYKCQKEFGDNQQQIYNEHIKLHEMDERQPTNNWMGNNFEQWEIIIFLIKIYNLILVYSKKIKKLLKIFYSFK
jgi:hypothetical protein